MLNIALKLAAAGHKVFPADPETRKPMVAWGSEATTDAPTIEGWWAARPKALPAIALSARDLVIDVDPRNGGDVSFEKLLAAHPELKPAFAAAPRVKTARGGWHFYFTLADGQSVKNQTNAWREEFGKGLDVKTAGGFVIAPGAVRADGLRYGEKTDAPPVPAPDFIVRTLARTPKPEGVNDAPVIWAAGESIETAMVPGLVRLLTPRLVDEGQRHETARALGGALAVAGWTDEGITDVIRGLPSNDVTERVKDALGAAARAREGLEAPQWGALARGGYAPAIVAAAQVMATGGKYAQAEAEAFAAFTVAQPAAPTILKVSNVYANIPPVPWLCESLRIAPGAPSLVAGYGGVGKSWLVQLLIVCVVTGKPFLGHPVRQGRVRHYDYEQGERITLTRYQRLAAAMGVEADALNAGLDIIPRPGLRLTDPDARARLSDECAGYSLAVFDALRGAAAGLDENDSRFREPLDMLLGVSDVTACTMLCLHHNRKASRDNAGGQNQNMRGSSAINDAAQVAIMLESASHGFNVECGKVRDGAPFKPFGVELKDIELARDDVNFMGLSLEIVDSVARAREEREADLAEDCQAVAAYARSQPGGKLPGRAAIAAGTGLSERRVRAAIELLEADRLVLTDSAGQKTVK